jgi:hypothetical protein
LLVEPAAGSNPSLSARLLLYNKTFKEEGSRLGHDSYALRWQIEAFHEILKSDCKAEESKLRAAER